MRYRSHADVADRRMLLRRIIIYSSALFLLGVIQCAFFSRLKPFGAVPDIVLGGICAVLMLDNKKSAAICAVGAGYFVEAIGSASLSFTPVFYLVAVLAASSMIDKMMPSIVSFAVSMLALSLLEAAYTWINMCIISSSVVSVGSVWLILLRAALSTLVFSLPLYFIFKLCTLPIESSRR